MNPAKAELRISLKRDRLALAPEVRQEKSDVIAARLPRAADWSAVRDLHCFEPVVKLGEVDLASFIENLKDTRPGIQIYTSRKVSGEWQVVSADTDKQPETVPKFDVIIVPMLGFDEDLHRIGYGGGYYDKFLAAQPSAKKIGVCFETGKITQLPREPHDIALDMIITERHTYTP